MDDNNTKMQELLKKIKANKKYSSISDEIVKKEIEKFSKRYQANLYNDKVAIKVIRKELHRLYSSYQTKGKRKRNAMLNDLRELINKNASQPEVLELTNTILKTTLATKERLDKYPTIYQKIFKITGKPKSITDLGCGLNPISIPYMKLGKIKYNAYDIDEEDINFLNEFFKTLNIDGKAKILDARETDELSKLPKTDIILMFKLYDLIIPKSKKQRKRISEDIINTLKTKANYLVISFATKTLTRRSMKLPRRIGFEMLLDRNQLSYEFIETDNEIYYVVF